MKQLCKRIIAIGVCSLLISMHLFILGGSGYRDEKLVKAEEITKALIVANDEEYDGECSGYYIKGLDEQEDYILVTSNKGGYAIFTTEFQLIEYSPYNTSPFGETAKADSYYAGPANYFEKAENEEIKNVHTGEKIAQEEKLEIATAVKGALKDILEQDKLKTEEIKKIEIEQKQKEEKNRVKTIEEHEELNQQSLSLGTDVSETNAPPTVSGIEDIFTDGVVSSTVLIDDFNYFVQSPYIGVNDNGDSAAIATQLFLSFNNWSKDSRLITEPKFLARYDEQGQLKDGVLDEPYSKDYISTTYISDYGPEHRLETTEQYVQFQWDYWGDESGYFEGILQNPKSFFEYIYYDLECLMGVDDLSQITNTTINYIDRYTELTPFDYRMGVNPFQPDSADLASEEIDVDRPTMAVIETSYEVVDGIIQDIQWVVVYGKQRLCINNVYTDGFIAHFGFEGLEYVWFNRELLNSVIVMELYHEHDYQPVEDNAHIIECSIENGGCGSRKTTENHAPNYWSNCDLIYNFKTEEETDYHFAYCSCGFAQKAEHMYTYENLNQDFHNIKCSACNLTPKQERHTFKYGYCYFCGVTAPE